LLKAKHRAVQKENKVLTQRSNHRPQVVAKAVKKAAEQTKNENHMHCLVKGVYDQSAHPLARLLVQAAQDWVGKIIQAVLEMASFECSNEMSRCTDNCAILEGAMLADMQIGHHLARIKGMLFL
jgi:hypothetical protein